MPVVSLLINQRRPAAWMLARRAVEWLKPRGIDIKLPVALANALGDDALAAEESELSQTDLIVTLGGDGTILGAARMAVPHQTPILGVNLGRFGFIATVQPDNMEAALSTFFDNKHLIEERMMVKCSLSQKQQGIENAFALNEIVIHRPLDAPMLNFGIFIDEHRVTAYPADGIIVSTPTGSTAYNLSAGGPIVEPTMQAMTLTAISPHTLGARPFVTRPEAVITLRVESQTHAILVCDGQSHLHVEPNETVKIMRAEYLTRLVTFRPDDFYTKMGKRLLYGVRIEEE